MDPHGDKLGLRHCPSDNRCVVIDPILAIAFIVQVGLLEGQSFGADIVPTIKADYLTLVFWLLVRQARSWPRSRCTCLNRGRKGSPVDFRGVRRRRLGLKCRGKSAYCCTRLLLSAGTSRRYFHAVLNEQSSIVVRSSPWLVFPGVDNLVPLLVK